jgi:Kdo2-lipid IVA lauroyltransferase/acyltransferase
MNSVLRRLRRHAKRAGGAFAGVLAVGLLNLMRLGSLDRTADIAAWVMRTIGPWLRENRLGRDNLTAAFPEKSKAEIEIILRGVWDNLGRMGAEFAQLERLWDYDYLNPNPQGRIVLDPDQIGRFVELMNDGKPALVFAAHLANWELPAISAATYQMDSAVLYRSPNNAAIDKWLRETRAANMGEIIATDLSAPVKLAEALKRGAHVGMLVDQYYVRGVEVTFFGRRTRANPLLARLAQHFNCPIRGARIIRLPGGHRFRGELTEEIQSVRDAAGQVDIAGTMQVITTIVEGWIREHPEQWLWLHRRWRPEDAPNAVR